MSALHGCEPFERLWSRRRTLRLAGVGRLHVLALADLVQAKKTQRDKDWPMVRRLLEADYHRHASRPTRDQSAFWLREVRTADLLVQLCHRFPRTARRMMSVRTALQPALQGDHAGVKRPLQVEQERYRVLDQRYWAPLRAELAP